MTPNEMLQNAIQKSLPDLPTVEDIKKRVQHLAHYTSLRALEQICSSGKIWFSNPQFMNDLHEMNYGIERAYEYVLKTRIIENAMGLKESAEYARQQLWARAQEFFSNHAPNVYVFCMSSHDDENLDGELSMWRAYGEHGKGAALVINTDFLREHGHSPLLMAEVQYQSLKDRERKIYELLMRWGEFAASIRQGSFNTEEQSALIQGLFLAIVILALTTKHAGFREEREWRLIYLPDADQTGILKPHFSYAIGERGIEPKLKFPLEPMPLEPVENWNFESIIHRLIIGPGMKEQLHRTAIERLLDGCERTALKSHVIFSSIPLRIG